MGARMVTAGAVVRRINGAGLPLRMGVVIGHPAPALKIVLGTMVVAVQRVIAMHVDVVVKAT